MLVHQLHVHVGIFGTAWHEHRHPVDAVFALKRSARHRAVLGVFIAVVVLQHTKIGQLVEQLVKGLVVVRVVFLSVPLHQFGVGMMLTHGESLVADDVKQQVERGFTSLRIHLVLEDTSQAPIFGGIGVHLDFTGDAVGDFSHQFDELGVGILVALVLGDIFGGHFGHGILV